MPPIGLRQNILAFYSDPNAPIETKKHPGQWKKVEQELIVLRDMPATRIPNAKVTHRNLPVLRLAGLNSRRLLQRRGS